MKKKVIAFVPMKLNNERLPGKNTMILDGKPLYEYILNTLSRVPNIDEVYVYCSDENLEKSLPNNIKYIKRSTNLDKNTTKGNEIWKCFADDVKADIYVLAHSTAPFVTKGTFELGIEKVLSGEYDSSMAVKTIQTFCWKNNEPMNFEPTNLPRTQDLEPMYMETSGMYVYNAEIINTYNKRVGKKPYLVEVSEIECVDIDEKKDFEFAEIIARGLK